MVIYSINCIKVVGSVSTNRNGVGFRCTTKSNLDLSEELLTHYTNMFPGHIIEPPNFLDMTFEEVEIAYNAMKENKETTNEI